MCFTIFKKYPVFKLSVKGYYGQMVDYCLHMLNWTTTFDSTTGNFERTTTTTTSGQTRSGVLSKAVPQTITQSIGDRIVDVSVIPYMRTKTVLFTATDFKPDVFIVNQSKYKSYSYGMPVRIIELLVSNYTDKNDIVYDPFMGSGTTAEACENTRRRWIGSEIDEKYGELVKERMGLGAEDL